MSIGAAIKMARGRAGLSQEKLSDIVEVSQSAIAAYEAGTVYPRWDVTLSICKATGVTITWMGDRATEVMEPEPDDETVGGGR